MFFLQVLIWSCSYKIKKVYSNKTTTLIRPTDIILSLEKCYFMLEKESRDKYPYINSFELYLVQMEKSEGKVHICAVDFE